MNATLGNEKQQSTEVECDFDTRPVQRVVISKQALNVLSQMHADIPMEQKQRSIVFVTHEYNSFADDIDNARD